MPPEVNPDALTVDAYADALYLPAQAGKSRTWLEECVWGLNLLSGVAGRYHLADLKADHLQTVLNRLDSHPSQWRARKVLGHFVRSHPKMASVDMRFVRTTIRNVPRQVEPYSAEEIRKLLAVSEGWVSGNAIKLASILGLRMGECMGLRWENVRGGVVHVVEQEGGEPLKTPSSYRKIYAPAGFLEGLSRGHAEYVVVGRNRRNVLGSRRSETGEARGFYGAVERAGLRRGPTFHDLRASCATGLAGLGCPTEIIEELLGHSKQGVTRRVYVRTTLGEKMRPWLERWHQEVQGD
jgi:integrase